MTHTCPTCLQPVDHDVRLPVRRFPWSEDSIGVQLRIDYPCDQWLYVAPGSVVLNASSGSRPIHVYPPFTQFHPDADMRFAFVALPLKEEDA